ncbi:MAG: hypothetical protein PVG33_14830 [Chloroflexota bacterium]|jgi:hypothetical protein
MRGYNRCRSHLDPLLGPRGAGAPRGNLNALKTGEHINPIGYVWALLAPYAPRQRLKALVGYRRDAKEKKRRREQTTGQPTPTNPTSE